MTRRPLLTAGVLVAALAIAPLPGCAPQEKPVTAEAVARINAARREAMEAAAAARTAGGGDTEATRSDSAASKSPSASTTQVTLEPERGAEAPKTLGEAAAAERDRRRDAPPRSAVVITNDNLADYAAQGQVTVATVPDVSGESAPAPDPAAAAAAPAPGDDPRLGGPRDEEYWRHRAREVRTRWSAAADEVVTLEEEAGELRWAFYAADDPYYRDQRIKPQWDRVLDELRRARQDVRAYRRELDDLLDEGREQGALPGWLREGVELEPDLPAEEEPERRDSDPAEPTIYDETGPDPTDPNSAGSRRPGDRR